MTDFVELAKTVGLPVAICLVVLYGGWRLMGRLLARSDRQQDADRSERQQAWDTHAAAVAHMTDAHAQAMREISAAVARMADSVAQNTEAIRACPRH